MSELSRLDAVAQAELVRTGQISPLELAEMTIRNIEAVEPRINAFHSTSFEETLDAARSDDLPNGPFRGVPFAVKDLGFHLKGARTFEGNGVLKEIDYRSPIESHVGKRLRAAGFVIVGKTATPEFGAQPTTQPLAFEPTRNPWDLERSTSGSSGGAAAAVASGMLSAAHASDGGGSIRQPASWCGLVGLKPSRGRIPRPAATSRLGTELAVTKSVRDAAAILDVMHGTVPGDLFAAPVPQESYVAQLGKPPGKLRLGILTSVDHAAVEVHPEARIAVERSAKLLEGLGHAVEESHPDRLFDETFLVNAETDYASRMLATIGTLWRAINRELGPGEVEPYTWARMNRASTTAGVELLRAESWLQSYSARIISWWEDYDLLVTPTTGQPPLLLSDLEVDNADPFAIDLERFASIRCFVRPFNVTGQPAISLPLHMTQDGLPLGIQLVAAPYREDLLIRAASQIEGVLPWTHPLPSP